MDLWPRLSLRNLTITESLPAICHWMQVINLLSGAMIRSFQSSFSARASGGQLFNGLLSLQLVSWPGSWGQEETGKAVSNKRGIGKQLHQGKSSFGSSDWALDLLRHWRWNGNILKQWIFMLIVSPEKRSEHWLWGAKRGPLSESSFASAEEWSWHICFNKR